MTTRISNSWKRISNYIRSRYPEMMNKVRGPASQENIDRLQELAGSELPQELVESYRLHDGVDQHVRFMYNMPLLSTLNSSNLYDGIIANFELAFEDDYSHINVDRDINILKYLNNSTALVPIGSIGNSMRSAMCVEIEKDPSLTTHGRIIYYDIEEGFVRIISDSISATLETFANDLERDIYSYYSDEGMLTKDKSLDFVNHFS